MPGFGEMLKTLTTDGDTSGLPVDEWRTAVEGLVGEATADVVVAMARAAHGRPATGWEELFSTRVAAAGGQPPRGSRALSVLAGAALVTAYADERRRPLAMYCAAGARHAGWRPALEQVGSAAALAEAAAVAVRKPSEVRAPKVTVTPASYEQHIPAPGSPVSGQELAAVVAALAAGVSDALQRGQRSFARAAENRELALREEVAVLRWLLSGYSTAADAAWGVLPPAVAAVAAAIDLDGLTRFPFGVVGAGALLAQTVALSAGDGAADGTGGHVLGLLPDPGPLTDLAPAIAAARDGAAVNPVALYDALRLLAAYRDSAW